MIGNEGCEAPSVASVANTRWQAKQNISGFAIAKSDADGIDKAYLLFADAEYFRLVRGGKS